MGFNFIIEGFKVNLCFIYLFVSLFSMTGLMHEIFRPGEPGVYVRLSVYYYRIKARNIRYLGLENPEFMFVSLYSMTIKA